MSRLKPPQPAEDFIDGLAPVPTMKNRYAILVVVMIASTIGLVSSAPAVSATESKWPLSNYISVGYYYNESLEYDTDIYIQSGGRLRLSNMTLTVIDRSWGIEVASGGELVMENVTVISGPGSHNFNIKAFVGSKMNLTDSRFEILGQVTSETYSYDGRSIWIATDDARVERCTFIHSPERSDVVSLVLRGDKGPNTVIQDNIFTRMGDASTIVGVYGDGGDLDEMVFKGNLFNGLPGIDFRGVSNLIVENCNFSVTVEDRAAVSISNSENVTISGCGVASGAQTLIGVVGSVRVNVTGNTLNSMMGKGIVVTSSMHSTVVDNHYTGKTVGVELSFSINCTVDSNVIEKNGVVNGGMNAGIDVFGDNNQYYNHTLVRNNISMVQVLGVHQVPINLDWYLDGANLTLDATNTLNDAPIRFLANLEDAVVDLAAQDTGMVYLLNVTNSIVKNADIAHGGVQVLGTATNLTIQNVSVQNSVSDGLNVYKGSFLNLTVFNCTFRDSAGVGVRLFYVTRPHILAVYIEDCFIGIRSDYSSDVLIKDTSITGCGDPTDIHYSDVWQTGAGVVLFGENVTINNVVFRRNWFYGLWVLHSSSTNVDVSIQACTFIQYIMPHLQKYSVSTRDDCTQGNDIWFGNQYSEFDFLTMTNHSVVGDGNYQDSNMMAYDSFDGDGVSDVTEEAWGSSMYLEDTDGEGISDYNEIFVYRTSPAVQDTDADDLTDYEEIQETGTNPLLSDTDGDGFDDYEEYFLGTDGNNPEEYPGSDVEYITDVEQSGLESPEDLKTLAIPGYPAEALWAISAIGLIWVIKKRCVGRQNDD
jgi:parallel beta-helix repeat protein